MIYEEYYIQKLKYKKIENDYNSFLNSGCIENLQDKIQGYKLILEEKKLLLDEKKKELEESKDSYDVIYRLRWIEHQSVNRISRKVCYSPAQTYRKINEINKNLKMIQNDI